MKKHIGLLLCSSVILSACGGSASDDSPAPTTPEPTPLVSESPTPTITPTPTPTPTATPTPTPSAAERLTVLECGAESGDISGNNLDDEAKSFLLCKHNEVRSQVALGLFVGSDGNLPAASNMTRLQWSDDLERVAQTWADQCIWQHKANRQAEYNALSPSDIDGDPISGSESVGENIAYFASSRLTSATIDFAINGFDAWIDEGHAYAFGSLNGSDSCSDDTCGHFTQAIWDDTYKVGCAVNFCAAGTVASLPATYLVCNYASAGNFIGKMLYLLL